MRKVVAALMLTLFTVFVVVGSAAAEEAYPKPIIQLILPHGFGAVTR